MVTLPEGDSDWAGGKQARQPFQHGVRWGTPCAQAPQGDCNEFLLYEK